MYDICEIIDELDENSDFEEYEKFEVHNIKMKSKTLFEIEVDQETVNIDLEKVIRVSIVTTDWGPYFNDVFLIIHTDDKRIFIVESEAPFYHSVYDVVSSLSGFIYSNVIEAMQSTDIAEFVCYTKSYDSNSK